ncbi:MAG: M56 family metallopeptidase, partial [Pseudonocardiaceae bacterium]
ASPRLLAAGHFLSLVGWAFLPAVGLVWAALGLAWLLTRPASSALVPGTQSWHLLTLGLVTLLLGPLCWQAVRALAAARHTELRGHALMCARQCRLRDGASVWIVPAPEPLAFASGVVRPRAVVTTGLLALLNPSEREAVLAHEAAHVRLGHPRLLVFGATVARVYGFLPPVRRAWAGLRRELEVAADDEAARQVGSAPLLSAMARIGLTRTATSGKAAFGDAEHLRYRLLRLQQPRGEQAWSVNIGVVALSGLFATALAWCACTLIVPRPTLPNMVMCLGMFIAVASRPMWSWRPATKSSIATG